MSSNIYQDEASLFEVFHPLVRRWKILLAGVVLGTLVAALITAILPKQYETSVLLQVGAVNDRQLEESYTVAEIINSDSFRQTVANALKINASRRQLDKMIHADTNMLRPSPMVTVHVLAGAPQQAVDLAEAVANDVRDRHKVLFASKVQFYDGYAKDLADKIAAGNEEIADMRKDLVTFRSSKESNISSILLLETKISNKELDIVTWEKDLRDTLVYMSPMHSHNTAMVALPVFPRRPSKPNLILNVVIGFFGSIFLMTSFVLLFEQYRKASARI